MSDCADSDCTAGARSIGAARCSEATEGARALFELRLLPCAPFSGGGNFRLVLLANFDTCCTGLLLLSVVLLDLVGMRLVDLRRISGGVASFGSVGGLVRRDRIEDDMMAGGCSLYHRYRSRLRRVRDERDLQIGWHFGARLARMHTVRSRQVRIADRSKLHAKKLALKRKGSSASSAER